MMTFFQNLWRQHRALVIAGAVLIVAAIGVAAYLVSKRPADVSNENAEFRPTEQPLQTRNWPMYGLNPQRTRYMPSDRVKPPYVVDWKYRASTLLEYSPIVVDGTLYGLDNRAEAFAVDVETGKQKWKRRVAQLNASAPTYSKGTLYISNLEPGQALALDAKTGKQLWRRALPGRTESSPVVSGNKVILGCECGTLFALNAKTGQTIWETEMGGEVKAAPALEDGIVYVADYGSQVTAVNAANGQIKWQSGSQAAGLGQSGRFYGTPAVAFGRVYVGNVDGRMYSFEQDTGELAWSQSTGDFVYAAPVAADTPQTQPTIYFGSYDGNFYALDARSGAVRWQQPAGSAVSGAASLIGDIVYVANLRKTKTIGFNPKTGGRLFSFHDGAYNPAISDGKRLYLTGVKTIWALRPLTAKERKRHKARGGGSVMFSNKKDEQHERQQR